MPRFGRGRGASFGPGYWPGVGFGRGLGLGRGMGNPYPFCRFYPWLPRRWWAMGMSPLLHRINRPLRRLTHPHHPSAGGEPLPGD